jgi:hemerythrin
MPLMAWSERMSVGVATLDEDHKKLVSLLNELFDGVQAGQGQEAVGKILDRLIAYTVEHFKREEQFFQQTCYPDAAAHRVEHGNLCKQVLDIQQKYKTGVTATLSLEVMNFLKTWLINHIQGSDKKYGPFLNSKGLQ